MKRMIFVSVMFLTAIFSQNAYVNKGGQVRLTPRMINYQGFLTDTLGNPVNINSLSMNIAIYDQETGGHQLWVESQSPTVEKGIFSILLGSETPIPDSIFTKSPDRWLEITVGLTSLTPRTRIVATPYAYTAAYSDTATYARSAPPDTDWIIAGSDMRSGISGNVGIGMSPSCKLDVSGKVRCQNTRTSVMDPGYVNTTATSWADLPSMQITVTTGNMPVLIIAHIGGVWETASGAYGYFRLLIDGTEAARQVCEFPSAGYVGEVLLPWTGTLTAASHIIKVQWYQNGGTLYASYNGSMRQIIVWE